MSTERLTSPQWDQNLCLRAEYIFIHKTSEGRVWLWLQLILLLYADEDIRVCKAFSLQLHTFISFLWRCETLRGITEPSETTDLYLYFALIAKKKKSPWPQSSTDENTANVQRKKTLLHKRIDRQMESNIILNVFNIHVKLC